MRYGGFIANSYEQCNNNDVIILCQSRAVVICHAFSRHFQLTYSRQTKISEADLITSSDHGQCGTHTDHTITGFCVCVSKSEYVVQVNRTYCTVVVRINQQCISPFNNV